MGEPAGVVKILTALETDDILYGQPLYAAELVTCLSLWRDNIGDEAQNRSPEVGKAGAGRSFVPNAI